MIKQPHRLLIPRPARDPTSRSLALDPSKTYFLQTLGPNVGICCMLGLFWRSVTIARILGDTSYALKLLLVFSDTTDEEGLSPT